MEKGDLKNLSENWGEKGPLQVGCLYVVETNDAIYMIETKARKDLTAEDVLAKKRTAEEYCKNATEYTIKNGGKPWKYHLLGHDIVDRTNSFDYLMALG